MCKRKNSTEKKEFIFQSDMSAKDKSVNYKGEGHGESLLIIMFWFYIFYIKVC